MNNIRPPLEQPWYPKDPDELSHNIETYINNADIKPPESKIYGIIVPHAGHFYSGQVAAYAFNCIKNLNPDTVVILSPSHFIGGDDIIVSSHSLYSTPLGNIEIDIDLLEAVTQKLENQYGISSMKISNDPEHSIEVELPFLQMIYDDFKIVPIMIRTQNENVSKTLGYVLSEILPLKDTILIASSDLSHYYDQRIANSMDSELIKRIESFDPESVLKADEQQIAQACGIGAIGSVLWACKNQGAQQVKILKYATSGDVSGDYDRVVGYVSALIT